MKIDRFLLPAVLAVVTAIPAAASAAPSCTPLDNTARILTQPTPNAIHPDWRGSSYVGTAWTFVPKGAPVNGSTGVYAKGDLYSARGGVVNKGIFILLSEWQCS
jgi:hypothetical protein